MKKYASGGEKPPRLPRQTRQIRHTCLWTTGLTRDERPIRCNKAFKSLAALNDPINYDHKGKKRIPASRGGGAYRRA